MNFSHYLALHSLQLHMHNLIMMAALITTVPRALQTSVCGTIKISRNNDETLQTVPQCGTIRGCGTNQVNMVYI